MPLTLNSTLTDVIAAFIALDAAHPIGAASVGTYREQLQVVWGDTSRVILELNPMSLTPSGVRFLPQPYIDVPGGVNPNNPQTEEGSSTVSPLNDGLYYKEDFTDIDCVGSDAHSRYLAATFQNTPAAVGVSFNQWSNGHAGVLQLKNGTSGNHATVQRNYGFGSITALDLSKVNKLTYRSVVMFDTFFLQYGGGGEQTWGVLSQSNPICGAMFSIAPGFVDTSGATAGQNLITGTYLDASVPTMQDLSRPAALVSPNVWYDTLIVWTNTSVQFWYRVWTAGNTNPWVLAGTNTLFIGTGMPVYPTHACKSYGDSAGRSMFLDLEELYIDISTPSRFLAEGLLSF